jgi:transposase
MPEGDIRDVQQRRQTMENDITVFVGLDVHKDAIAIAVAYAGREAPRFVGTVGPALPELLWALRRLGEPGQVLLAYEAGPCGFALARRLAASGWRCQVIAVSKMPVRPGARIKTDRRDALTLAGYLRAGELTPVVVPDAVDEAIRDLSRAREDAVRALMCTKGIDLVAAVTLIAELGDLHRFEHPQQRMAYLGLVPSEYSSGQSRARGSHHQDRQHPCTVGAR